jgi:cob(I)alamin adenosyltransferase
MFFTGTGDDGRTNLFHCDQQRISKSSEVPEALGALDELNAFLGLVKVHTTNSLRIGGVVREVQENLFIIQAQVGGADKKVEESAIGKMEKIICEIEKEIPPITSFTIAGGAELSALLDVARTLARSVERRLVVLREVGKSDFPKISSETLAYVNRLSSLLFALARLANHQVGVAEENPRY